MKFSDYPQTFRSDAVAFWVGAAQSIACSSDIGAPTDINYINWSKDVAAKADALTQEFLKRLLPEKTK